MQALPRSYTQPYPDCFHPARQCLLCSFLSPLDSGECGSVEISLLRLHEDHDQSLPDLRRHLQHRLLVAPGDSRVSESAKLGVTGFLTCVLIWLLLDGWRGVGEEGARILLEVGTVRSVTFYYGAGMSDILDNSRKGTEKNTRWIPWEVHFHFDCSFVPYSPGHRKIHVSYLQLCGNWWRVSHEGKCPEYLLSGWASILYLSCGLPSHWPLGFRNPTIRISSAI